MTLRWITNHPKTVTELELAVYWQGNRSAYERWRNQFIEDRPQATEELTVKQLEKYGMIGLYREEGTS